MTAVALKIGTPAHSRLMNTPPRTTVQRAYVGDVATLVDSKGRVFNPRTNEWEVRLDSPQVVRVGKPYATWSDVPFSWCGGCPYFR